MAVVDYLHPVFLHKVLEQRPDLSRNGYRQQFIQPELFPWKDFKQRHILLHRAMTHNNLAGLYGPKGQALPTGDLEFERSMASLQDVKSAREIDPELARIVNQLNELQGMNAGSTAAGQNMEAVVQREVTRKMGLCDDDVDSTLEYFAAQVLHSGQIVWPPVDNSGAAISSPPSHWNAQYAGTWTFPLPARLNQDIAALVDYEGNNPGANYRKYWSDTTADVLGQFRVINEIAQENHAFSLRGGTLVCRQTTLTTLTQNAAIRDLIRGANQEQTGARGFVTQKALEDWFKTELDFKIRTYDAFFTYDTPSLTGQSTVTQVHYLPKNKIFILPPGGRETIGSYMGTAPIENANKKWNPGKMPWSYRNPKPNYEQEVGVNVIAWPVIEYYQWAALQVLA